MNDYPSSIAQLDVDGIDLSPAVLIAVRTFARSRPWRGSVEERKAEFRRAIRRICQAAGARQPKVILDIDERVGSGCSCYIVVTHAIILRGRLSVITMLHEIGHLLHGHSEMMAGAWSLAYFRTCFPQSWQRLSFDGHMAVANPLGQSCAHCRIARGTKTQHQQ